MTARDNWEKAEFWGKVAMWCAAVQGVAGLVLLACLLVSL
jgi:hypothetical protein